MKGFMALLLILLVALPACSARTSFGLIAECKSDNCVGAGDMCVPHGSIGDSAYTRIDSKAGGPPPHLWLTWTSSGGTSPIYVELYEVDAYESDRVSPRPILVDENLLARRTYDKSFGYSRETDEFTVSFERQDYRISVRGLRGDTNNFLSKPDDCLGEHEFGQ